MLDVTIAYTVPTIIYCHPKGFNSFSSQQPRNFLVTVRQASEAPAPVFRTRHVQLWVSLMA